MENGGDHGGDEGEDDGGERWEEWWRMGESEKKNQGRRRFKHGAGLVLDVLGLVLLGKL